MPKAPPKPILALETGEQSGERDVAIAAVAPTKAVVDNVGDGGAPLLAEVELSNAVEGGVEAEGREGGGIAPWKVSTGGQSRVSIQQKWQLEQQ